LIPIDAMDWQAEYDQLRHELSAHSDELVNLPHCVVFTKMDLFGEDYLPPIETQSAFGMFAISAAARTGIDELLAAWWSELLKIKQSVVAEAAKATVPLP